MSVWGREPRSLCRHGRRRRTIHEFPCQELGLSSAFRLATALWLQDKKKDHGGHGGIPEVTEQKCRYACTSLLRTSPPSTPCPPCQRLAVAPSRSSSTNRE